MVPPWVLRSAGCLLLLTGVFLYGGCDNTIEPFSEEAAYSVHGVLFTSQSSQFVRVKPLAVPISKVDSGTLSGTTVTLENVTDGKIETLEDSIVTFKDAGTTIVTHNFWTDSPIPPETKYRLTVEGQAGRVQATTTTPTASAADVIPKKGKCTQQYAVEFEDVDDPRRVRARIEMKLTEARELPKTIRDGDWVQFPQENIFRTRDGRTVLLFNPASLLEPLVSEFELSTPTLPDTLNPRCWETSVCGILDVNKIRVRYTYLGPDWYGEIPEDSVSFNPLRSYDVRGGLGFFGSARRDRSSSRVDTSRFVFEGGIFCNEEPP